MKTAKKGQWLVTDNRVGKRQGYKGKGVAEGW